MHTSLQRTLRAGALLAASTLASGVGITVLTPGASAAAPTSGDCTTTGRSFVPTQARLSDVPGTYRVIRVKRKGGAIGTPPVTSAGKRLVGWDPATKPGSDEGTVILDAHTWPDGSALGNTLLKRLHRGSGILLSARGSQACYRVTRVHSYPSGRVPAGRLFRPWGPPRLVIVVCSGKRLGPGDWQRRTIWTAALVGAGPDGGDPAAGTPGAPGA